ncbi:TPA: hypothetical protein U5E31_004182 [Yersinia enterocolitica]|nr:hypothetical protein [Yersinia enterocolitica]HEN3611095.1 hypothetical protein [Yersinia enterocolitica]HEN3623340.1 hypothetical protein [Yersinia enterocolitica]HEN3627444.1 hypothetical protein [Yersinia enterocolitica]HEN3643884.1 hypothetical protein [Yersinia enterocolitica]
MHSYLYKKSFKTPGKSSYSSLPIALTNIGQVAKIITYINIILQLIFPLSLSFIPVIAFANAPSSHVMNASIEPYALGTDKNIETAAKKYSISVDELKRINIYRSVSKPSTPLTSGDVIDMARKLSPFAVDKLIDYTGK